MLEKVLECYEILNVMWLNGMYYTWMMKIVWNWYHTFGIIVWWYIKYEKPMFNIDHLTSLMI